MSLLKVFVAAPLAADVDSLTSCTSCVQQMRFAVLAADEGFHFQ